MSFFIEASTDFDWIYLLESLKLNLCSESLPSAISLLNFIDPNPCAATNRGLILTGGGLVLTTVGLILVTKNDCMKMRNL